MKRVTTALALAGAMACAANASAQMLEKKTLSLAEAMKVSAAAQDEAKKNNWVMSIAVFDDGGNLIVLHRMDEAFIGSVQVAQDKGRSALQFKRPTKVFEDGVAGGRHALLGLTGAMPIEGGVPIMSGGKIVGAIGVSGGAAPQDGQVAKAGADTVK